MWRRIALTVVPTFLVGYLLTAFLFFGGGSRADVVTVPDVRALEMGDARESLDDSELELVVGDSLPNPTIPAGAVVAQSPLPGQEVAPETQVRVILSQGPERRVVPRVEGYPPSQAERMLAASGFQVSVQRVSDLRAAGRVVGTSPQAGSSVRMPAAVRLLVSAGPPIVAMPSVTGLLESEARPVLEGVGLRVGEVVPELRLDVASGMVLAQSPAAGDSIPAGRGVRLFVATDQPPAPPVEEPQMPDASETPPVEQGGEI